MNIRQVLIQGGVVLAALLCLRVAPEDAVPAEPPELHGLRPPQKISPALVGRMHGVTMLEFQTDRALQEIRVVVNEQIAGSLRVPVDDNQTNLKLATVVSSLTP